MLDLVCRTRPIPVIHKVPATETRLHSVPSSSHNHPCTARQRLRLGCRCSPLILQRSEELYILGKTDIEGVVDAFAFARNLDNHTAGMFDNHAVAPGEKDRTANLVITLMVNATGSCSQS